MPKIQKPKKVPNLSEIGSNTKGFTFGGLVSNSEYRNELKGPRAIQTYNEMRFGDGTVQAVLAAIRLPILSANWYVEAASEDTLDQEIRDFVEDNLMDKMTVTWQAFLSEALNYLNFGRYVFEKIYVVGEDGKVRLKKLSPRLPETITKWQTTDGQDGITQQIGSTQYSIPIEKLLILVNQKEGNNQEGISILRGAFKHFFIKDKLYIIDAIKAERQGLGIPEAEIPVAASEEDRTKLETILKNLRANEKGYAVYPEGWKVGWMDMKANTTLNLLPAILHHDRQISKSILAQFLELGSASGSYALSQDQTDLFLLSEESVVTHLKDAFNKYVIPQLVDYNYNGITEYPKLKTEPITPVDFSKLITAVSQGATASVIDIDQELKDYLRNAGKLPAAAEEFPVDPTMADDLISDLESEMDGLTSTDTTPTDVQASEADFEEVRVILGAPRGPLSEEWKQRISEALKRRNESGVPAKKGKKKNPQIVKKQAEIKALRNKIAEYASQVREDLLEKQAKGEKLDKKKTAKLRLQMTKKKNEISKQIANLQGEIDALRADEGELDTLSSLKERIDLVIDGE